MAAKIGINSESSKFWSDYFHLEENFFAWLYALRIV